MATAIRFTKPEREWLREWVTANLEAESQAIHVRGIKLGQSVLDKLIESERPKESRGAGLAVTDALDAFKSALGDRLVVPPTPGKPWWAMMGNGLKKYGLTRQQCVTIAKTAGAKWRSGFIKAESLVRQATVLLAEAQIELPVVNGGPAEMDDA